MHVSSINPAAYLRPRLRGVLHSYAAAVAVAAGAVLCPVAAREAGTTPFAACLIYAIALCGLFGVSALYHRIPWGPLGYAVMKRLDHAMIFVFIAATYTPFSVMLLPPDKGKTLLTVVWTAAAAGVVLKVAWPRAPRWVGVPLYLALGWAAVFVLPQMLGVGGVFGGTAVALLAAGGIIYSIGSVLYALKWPNPWPTVFGHHEFFHAATIIAAACHYVAVFFALYA